MKDIRPVQKDPYGKIKVYETETEKEKEKFNEVNNKKKLNFLLAFFVNTIQKMVKFFSDEDAKSPVDKSLTNTIIELKNHLKRIQEEDVSLNTEFFHNFSKEWKKILKIYHLTKITEAKRSLLKTLIDEFQKFPPNKEFSLSHALKSYQDKGFISHSFKAMIQELYINHQKDPINSLLKHWTSLLNKILTA